MRRFVKSRADGVVVSVADVEVLAEGVEHPWGTLEEGEIVVEVESEEIAQVPIGELSLRQKLDPRARTFVPFTEDDKKRLVEELPEELRARGSDADFPIG